MSSSADNVDIELVEALQRDFGEAVLCCQQTRTGMPVLWVLRAALTDILGYLKQLGAPYDLLYDLSATDERLRGNRQGLPDSDFTVFYQLMSINRNRDIMLKVALAEEDLSVPTATGVFPAANWYEREVWDMFGISFSCHPHLERILMPPTWTGHPCARITPPGQRNSTPTRSRWRARRPSRTPSSSYPKPGAWPESGTARSSCS